MDLETGRIFWADDEGLRKHFENNPAGRAVLVEEKDMTMKQRETSQVSLHDHTSTLGKVLTEQRGIFSMTKNQRRNLRKKGLVK